MIVRLIKQLLYGESGALRGYEENCIRRLGEALSLEAQTILDAQVRSLEHVQRFADDRLVRLHRSAEAQRTTPRFPNQGPELCAARLTFRVERDARLQCELIVHEGFLSALELSHAPRGLSRRSMVFVGMDLYENLMRPMPPPFSNLCALGADPPP